MATAEKGKTLLDAASDHVIAFAAEFKALEEAPRVDHGERFAQKAVGGPQMKVSLGACQLSNRLGADLFHGHRSIVTGRSASRGSVGPLPLPLGRVVYRRADDTRVQPLVQSPQFSKSLAR